MVAGLTHLLTQRLFFMNQTPETPRPAVLPDLGLKEEPSDHVNAVLQKALTVLEPFARLAAKFDIEPYSLSYPDTLRINGTGDNARMADVVRSHCFITLGDCRRARALFRNLERDLSLSSTKSANASGIPNSASANAQAQWEVRPKGQFAFGLYEGGFELLEVSDYAKRLVDEIARILRPMGICRRDAPEAARSDSPSQRAC